MTQAQGAQHRYPDLWGRITQAFGTIETAKIAQKLGISYQSVYKWEKGYPPGLETLVQISDLTNVSIHWLVTGRGFKLVAGNTLPEGESAIYFGEEEQRIIADLAKQSNRNFDEEVRELVLETLVARNLVTEEVEPANLIFFGDYVPKLVPMRLLGEIAAGAPIDVFEYEDSVLVAEDFVVKGHENFVLRVKGDSMMDEGILNGDLIICYVTNDANNGDKVVALIDGEKATVKKFYRERRRIRLQPANPMHQPIYLDAERVVIQGIVLGIQRRT
ncbi:MAG: transcriptional repressor LexA [Pyrinomonadaceae bacterium MAG19_C2-C3]|nr:transcriptional repressor LexA [Pyrinomonadaceae bacterium MAG19_C2-C3]